jgi:phospholipid-translocating ATPase
MWQSGLQTVKLYFRASLCITCSGQPGLQKEFILQTDASDRGVGAGLSQLQENGEDRPIAYYN